MVTNDWCIKAAPDSFVSYVIMIKSLKDKLSEGEHGSPVVSVSHSRSKGSGFEPYWSRASRLQNFFHAQLS